MPLVPTLRRQRQASHCESKASLGYYSEFQVSQVYRVRPCVHMSV